MVDGRIDLSCTGGMLVSVCWFLAGIGTLGMYLYDRNEKHKKVMESLKKEIVRKRKNKKEAFIAIHYFRSPSSGDTEPPSSADESSKVSL